MTATVLPIARLKMDSHVFLLKTAGEKMFSLVERDRYRSGRKTRSARMELSGELDGSD
jgi:hypothetical protein